MCFRITSNKAPGWRYGYKTVYNHSRGSSVKSHIGYHNYTDGATIEAVRIRRIFGGGYTEFVNRVGAKSEAGIYVFRSLAIARRDRAAGEIVIKVRLDDADFLARGREDDEDDGAHIGTYRKVTVVGKVPSRAPKAK